VNDLQDERPDIYGRKSAIAEGYMILDAIFGAGTMFGPLLSGVAYDYVGWTGCTIMLGMLSFSAIVPVVGGPHLYKPSSCSLKTPRQYI
jgi:MFS family permease